MEVFRLEKVAEVVHGPTTHPAERCRTCGGTVELIHKMLDSDSGRIIHMHQCECGHRTWHIGSNSHPLVFE
jgi:hypothetical protein